MSQGLLGFGVGGDVIYALLLTHATIVSVTLFLHRHQAHRALTFHPAVAHLFRFWLWLTTGMVTREWVAVHRRHHARCETEEDPHSPQVLGLGRVLWQGAELYREAAGDTALLEKYGKGTPDDWLERHLYIPHHNKGIALLLLLDLLLLGPVGLSVWAVQMLWIPLWAAGVINGVGHCLGYRNYATPDASTNIVPWGIVIGGEELHNNHHAFPGSARFASRWWELDIGWVYLRLLETLGLARVRRVAPPPARVGPAASLDGEAVRAIIASRQQVLAGYRRQVLRRVLRHELRMAADRRLRAMLRHARRLLLREEVLLSEEARQRLEEVLIHNEALRTAHQFRQRLQGIWAQASHRPERALVALQEWRAQAERSGVAALEGFARRLGGYRLSRG